MTAPKLTPAMVEWCRHIAFPKEARLLRVITRPDYPQYPTYRTEGWPRKLKPSWAMADKLVEAGLIRWRRFGRDRKSREPQFLATLTPAGRAAANHGVKGARKPKANEWPFPVSTVYPKEPADAASATE